MATFWVLAFASTMVATKLVLNMKHARKSRRKGLPWQWKAGAAVVGSTGIVFAVYALSAFLPTLVALAGVAWWTKRLFLGSAPVYTLLFKKAS